MGSDDRPPFDQAAFHGRLEWGEAGARALSEHADLVVVVDVLSFSTAVSVAIERGVRVVPYHLRDRGAAELARRIGATLASPNRSAPGPTISPSSFGTLRHGDLLVLPSPAGASCAAVGAESGAMVVAGCLRNAAAVGRFAAERGWVTAVVAVGESWPDGTLRPAVEDLIGAGAILAQLPAATLSPESSAAVAAFRSVAADLEAALASSTSGRQLVLGGLAADVALAARLDATDQIPVLVEGTFRSHAG